MLTFSHIFSASKQNPTKKNHQWRDLSERKPIRRSGGFDKWVRRSGGFVGMVRYGAIDAVWVGSSVIWCESVRERWWDDLVSGVTISLLSLLSLSVSLFARGPEMASWSRWSVIGFDEGGFERSERCDCLAPMRSGCILAPTRRSSWSFSLSLSLSLFYFPRPKIIWSENENGNHFPPFWLYFMVNLEMLFNLIQFEVTTKHPLFQKIIFKISLKPKQTEP